MSLLEILDLVLQTLEPFHRFVVLVLKKFEIVSQIDLEWIVLKMSKVINYYQRVSVEMSKILFDHLSHGDSIN